MKIKLAKSEIIHFIGIGGIGMSGLSLIMKGKGFKVQGSDIASNKNIERVKKDKIKITIGHKKQNINKATIKNSMFQNAIITYSRLKDTIFSGCDIRGVEFFGCNTEDALFTNVHEF